MDTARQVAMEAKETGWEVAWSFRIPEPTILLNRWQRMHWAEKRKYLTRLSWLVLAAVRKRPASPLRAAWIHVERGNPKPFPDPDGLVGGLKGLLDVLSCPRLRKPHGLGFIIDDAPQFLQKLTWESVATKRGEGYTQVTIYRRQRQARSVPRETSLRAGAGRVRRTSARSAVGPCGHSKAVGRSSRSGVRGRIFGMT